MLKINEGALDKLNGMDNTNTYIITDFDRTITTGDSVSTIGLVAKSGIFPQEYLDIRDRMYKYYRDIELDLQLDHAIKSQLIREWVENHIFLYKHYGLSVDKIDEMFNTQKHLIPRDGVTDFLKMMNEYQIPVVIISGGIGDFIKRFLIENDCYSKNIIIISNFLIYDNGLVKGTSKSIIHSMNKNKIMLDTSRYPSLKDRNNIIAFGDATTDVEMIPEDKRGEALKIGFLDEKLENMQRYREVFDIVGINNTSFDEINCKVKQLKK